MEHELVTCHGTRHHWPCPCQVGRFTLGKEPRYPSRRRLGGPHNRSGRLEEETTFLTLSEFKPQIVHPAAYSMYLSRDTFEILRSGSCEILKK
jgi:hypothetical protein